MDGQTNDGHIIRVNGTTMSQQAIINITGSVSGSTSNGETVIAISAGGNVNDTAYGVGWDGDNTTAASRNALYDKIEALPGGHDAVTLTQEADTVLSLSSQLIGFDTQAPNYIFAGPLSGSPTAPSFRALADADIPATITRNIDWDTAAEINAHTTDADFLTVEADPSVDTADKIEAILTNDNITFGTGIVTAAGFVGPLTGEVTGNTSGSSGSCTGNAATASAVEWANVQNVSANTTSDQATNTTSNVTFYNVTASGKFLGALTGEVTGNVSGNAGTATTASDSTDNTSVQYIQHVQAAGTVYVEPKINWINGTNMTFTVVNDTTGKQMNITGEVKAGVYQPADADLTTWAGITPGANVGTFLATPSSANLAAAVTDETGTGTAVFSNSPTFDDDIQLGKAGATGILKLYSEQGATDYTASFYPNTAMTSAASFYLPADEPAATSFISMSTGGVMSFVAPHAGTNIAADLEEEVTEGSLADSTIVSADIKDDTLTGNDINESTLLLTGQTKTISLYNWNSTGIWQGPRFPRNVTIKSFTGRTTNLNVTGALVNYNTSGGTPVNMNATNLYTTTQLYLTSFTDSAIALNESIGLNISAINGPTNFTGTIVYDEAL